MHKRRIILFLLFLLFAAGLAGNIHAASPKKKKKKHKTNQTSQAGDGAAADSTTHHYTRKEQRKIHKQERKRLKKERKMRRHGHDAEPVRTESERAEFKYPATKMKTRYRVDVLASMYLDELVKKGEVTFNDRIPDKAVPGISFYEGLTIAADSLKKAGFSIDIYVHDVASVAESPDTLVSKGILDSADLIIGAVPARAVPALAAYAKSKKINFVSALSPSDGGVTDNKYFTLIQPSLKTHCDWILDDVTKKFPGMKLALLYRTGTENDQHAYQYLTGGDDPKVTFRQFNCNTLPTKDSLTSVFDSTKPNVVIVSLFDPAAADSMLKKLSRYFPATHFEVYGMPSWTVIPALRKENTLPNLTVNVTMPFNIDPSTPMGRYVMAIYKSDYGGKATEYVYRGFETMYWYANLLKQYGTMFGPKYNDNSTAPFTKFEVKQQRDNKGRIRYNENTHIYISRYEAGLSKTE